MAKRKDSSVNVNKKVYQLLLKLFTTLVLIYGNASGTDIPKLA